MEKLSIVALEINRECVVPIKEVNFKHNLDTQEMKLQFKVDPTIDLENCLIMYEKPSSLKLFYIFSEGSYSIQNMCNMRMVSREVILYNDEGLIEGSVRYLFEGIQDF